MSDSLKKRVAIRMETTMATRRLTEQAILRRNAEIAGFRQASYAQALHRVTKVDQQKPTPAATQPTRGGVNAQQTQKLLAALMVKRS